MKSRGKGIIAVAALLLGLLSAGPVMAVAPTTYGNIIDTDKYAWSENAGWINFRPSYGGVTVYDDYLSGYAWAENIGWIKLGHDSGPYLNTLPNNWGVNKDGSGNLSGYGWSETVGWINFNPTASQVTIDPATEVFDGYAWSENVGWISFKGTSPDYGVIADTIAPDPPSTPDMTADTDSAFDTDNITNDTTPSFTGTAETGATINLYSDDPIADTLMGSTTATGGNWTITASALNLGMHSITAKAVDSAGNISDPSSSISVTIDTSIDIAALPAFGTYTAAQNVTLSAEETATVYYTLDGTTPTYPVSGTTQTGASPAAVNLSADTTLKFLARDTAGNETSVITEQYYFDLDADGLLDSWEESTFGNISSTDNPVADADGDGLTTLEEYRLGTDPQTDNAELTDEDGDNLPDSWEIAFFGSTSVDPFADGDGDGITNIREYYHAIDPTIDNADTGQVADSDGDGVPDDVEKANGTDPDVADGTSDPDGDGLTNLEEYYLGSGANEDNRLMTDTDNDGIPDRVEIAAGLDPSFTDDSSIYIDYMNGMLGMSTDSTDGDTIPDLWEAANGLDPTADNSLIDSDFDGITDLAEYVAGSNPMVNLPPAAVEITTANGAVFGVADTVMIAFNVTTDPEGQDVTYSAKLYEGFDTGAEPLETDGAVTPGGGYSPAYALAEDTIYTVVITASDGLVTSPVTTSSFVVSEGTIAGDSDYSGQVDGYDLIVMSVVFGKSSGDPAFNAFADLNDDGIIDGSDLAMLATNFGLYRP